jgi:hypothetical protein
MTRDILDDWRDEERFISQNLLENDIGLKEIAEEVGSWSEERKLNMLLDVLNGKNRNRDNSFGDKLTKALTGVIRIKRANELHRRKLGYKEN